MVVMEIFGDISKWQIEKALRLLYFPTDYRDSGIRLRSKGTGMSDFGQKCLDEQNVLKTELLKKAISSISHIFVPVWPSLKYIVIFIGFAVFASC